jgi:23S rRNA-/tRNA-specific pseudouridylate synthase
VGDSVYNRFSGRTGGTSSLVSRQFLHAAVLGFSLPGGERMRFEAPLPRDLSDALITLRKERDGVAKL